MSTRGRHEPLVITIRRPRARVALTRPDGELIMAALADAAGYREWRAQQWCPRCDAEPEGACEDHLHDAAATGAYRALAARLADVLPVPEGEAGLPGAAVLSQADPGITVIQVLRSAADALAVDLAAWEARDPGEPGPEARRARRSVIATADAVTITLSRLRAGLGGDRS